MLDGIKHCVSINYEGPRESVTSKNWPSTKNNISAVKQSVQNDISKGGKAGPFKKPFYNLCQVADGRIQEEALTQIQTG